MTMTEPEAPTLPPLECPRCGTMVAAEILQREGVTVMTVAEHDCVGDPHPAVLAKVEPGTHVEPAVKSAIDAAVEGALAMPGMPGRDEFLALAAQARMLSLSGAAPKLIREDPYLAFHVTLIGRDLGISPSAAIELIDVLPGRGDKGPQLSLSPQLLNGQIRRLGLGSIAKVQSDERHCIAVALEPGGRVDFRCKPLWPDHVDPSDPRGPCTCRGIMGDVEFDWEEARMAGLVGRECQPGEHKKPQGKDRCGCNHGYITYPKRMHWWRASGFAADDYFPEAGLGLYTAEELGAVVDEDGRPIDVMSVELPPGYEVAAPPPPPEADPDEIWALQERIRALPDDAKLTLRQRWEERITQGGAPIPAWALSADKLNLANALLRGAEASAKARKLEPRWDPETALQAVRIEVAGVVGALLGWLHGRPPSESPDPGPGPTEPAAAGEPAQDKPNAAEAAGGPDPAEAFKAQLAGATDAQVDEAIEKVKALDARHVDKELTRLRQHSEGEIADRRRRLGLALLYEALHGGPPPEQIP